MAKMVRRAVNSAPAEDYDESTVEDTPQDAAPRRTLRRPSGPIQSGWGAPTQQRRETVKAPYLQVETKKKLVKPLEDAPSVRFEQHYLKATNKFYTCIAADDTECPLCEVGHNPSRKFILNVVDMAEPETVKTWTFGPEVAQLLQEHVSDKPSFPLADEKTYFQVWRVKGANGRIQNRLEFVKSRDVDEEHQVVPLTEGELDALGENLYGEETVFIPSEKMLTEAARVFSKNSDDD